MSRTHFRPETDGFAFTNSWTFDPAENVILSKYVTDAVDVIELVLSPIIIATEGPLLAIEGAVPFIGPWLIYKTIQAQTNAIVNGIVGAIDSKPYGLCGGMAFASLDYWRKNWVLPRGTGANDQPIRTSPTGIALRDYIWTRLLDSVKSNVGTFLEWMAILHFDPSGGASLRDKTKAEIAKLKQKINAGTPVTVGLIGTTWNPMENHQVLVYGFQDTADGVMLFVYDNNFPGTETTYDMKFSGPELDVTENQLPGSRGPMRGLFCTTYTPSTPPRTVVLSKGLSISPAVTGVGNPVGVQVTAKNIGFHASPALALVIAGDAGAPLKEAMAAAIAEGGARGLNGNISIPSQGNHKVGVIASLGTFANIAITKFLPAEDVHENPEGSVVIVGERLIDADVSTVCQVSNVVGGVARYSVRVDDMGAGLTYAWKVVGAVITAGAMAPEVELQLPVQPGAIVTLAVTVKRPDGGTSSGSYTFSVITAMAAGLETVMCQLSHILTSGPFQNHPGDPGPDAGRVLNPGDIRNLAITAANLSQVANAAVATGARLTLSPSEQASRIAVISTAPAVAGVTGAEMTGAAMTGAAITGVVTTEAAGAETPKVAISSVAT